MTTEDLTAQIVERTRALEPELVEIRRDIHRHPEGARTEHRTTALVADRLRAAGLEPQLLAGTGLYCDVLP
ncbi:MAG TPA: amidohydrolase, partial [Actinotalea caeni]|nr:amidohydrolase [Actinotalea caeni]